jgi:hypothetical protein
MSNSIMLSSLSTCAAFRSKSNCKYLRSCADHGKGADGQLLQLAGDDAENPLTRFFVETSSKHDGLVHIRCGYNNKYWVAEKRHGDEWWIASSADKPEEDLSQESCTLFQLKPVKEDPKTVRLFLFPTILHSVDSIGNVSYNKQIDANLWWEIPRWYLVD